MVNAAKKAATIPMPMKARGFMPAGDLVADEKSCKRNPPKLKPCASTGPASQFVSVKFYELPTWLVRMHRQAVVGCARECDEILRRPPASDRCG